MTQIYELIRYDFDKLENRPSDAICRKTIGMFADWNKLNEYLKDNPLTQRIQYDDNLYPYYEVKKHYVR